MSRIYLTAIDLAARRGTDKEIGMVQQIVNYSPEIAQIMGRPIDGTFTEAKVQIGITDSGAFVPFNAGVVPGAGQYEMRRFDAFWFDSQLQVHEATAKAANQRGDSMGDLQADEIAGALMDKSIKFGQQLYGGKGLNKAGFPGAKDMLSLYQGVTDSRSGQPIVNYIDAGGTSAATECVWYFWVHPQGIHFLWGCNTVVEVNPWMWQYVNDPKTPNARLLASCSNLSGFVGLCCAHPWAVTCIKNIDATHTWTDAMSSQLDALMPAGIKPTHCFATKRARNGLQSSRTVTLFGQAGIRPDQPTLAPIPTTDVNGVPIFVTDSIQLSKRF